MRGYMIQGVQVAKQRGRKRLRIDIPWFESKTDFNDVLTKAPFSDQTFGERIQKLKYSAAEVEGLYHFWLTFKKDKHVLISFYESDAYLSYTFPQNLANPQHYGIPEACKSYYYFEFFDENEVNRKPCAIVRVSTDGKIGEIYWVEKGKNLTGTEVMESILPIDEFLQVEKLFLKDGAEDAFQRSLRILKPIAEPNGQPWYVRFGFGLFRCDALPEVQKGYYFEQDSDKLKEAIAFVKRFKLNPKNLKAGLKRAGEHFKEVFNKYFPNHKPDHYPTVGECISKVYQQVRSKGEPDNQDAQADLTCLYNTLLVAYHEAERKNRKFMVQDSKYTEAVEEMRTSMLYVKERPR